jgi:hypothetical protein
MVVVTTRPRESKHLSTTKKCTVALSRRARTMANAGSESELTSPGSNTFSLPASELAAASPEHRFPLSAQKLRFLQSLLCVFACSL